MRLLITSALLNEIGVHIRATRPFLLVKNTDTTLSQHVMNIIYSVHQPIYAWLMIWQNNKLLTQ